MRSTRVWIGSTTVYANTIDAKPCLRGRIEIAIVAIGGEARVLDCRGNGGAVQPTGDAFVPAGDFIPPTPLQARGVSQLGEGMRLALKLVRDRKDELAAREAHYYRPWILLVSDGAPSDDAWEQAADAAVAEEKRKGVLVYPVAVDKDADMTVLSRFSTRPPLRLRGLDFKALFEWPDPEAILAPSGHDRRYDEMRDENGTVEQALGDSVLADNPEPRCPVVLLLDVSASMQGEKIRKLNEGVDQFNYHVRQDQLACLRIEIAIVTVGGEARVLDCRGGGPVEPSGDAFVAAGDFIPPTPLRVYGSTPLGEGMRLALKLVRNRKDELRAEGVHLYRPWILLVSDGAPNDVGWEQAAVAAVAEERRKGVLVYPVAVDKDADMTVLSRFSTRPPLKLRGRDFPALFQWLSTSLGSVARSQPGDDIQLPDPREAWAEDWTRVKA